MTKTCSPLQLISTLADNFIFEYSFAMPVWLIRIAPFFVTEDQGLARHNGLVPDWYSFSLYL